MNDKNNIPEDDYLTDDSFGLDRADKDGDGIDDQTESEMDFDGPTPTELSKEAGKNFWNTKPLGRTLTGRNKSGEVIGFGLDVLTFFAPAGSKIDKLRQKGKQALNLNKDKNDMKDALKRAFTTDGGSFFRVRDEDGKISKEAILASIIRGLLIVGVLYVAHLAGVLSEAMKVFQLS